MHQIIENKIKYNTIINKGFYINKISDLMTLCLCVRKIPNVYEIMKKIIEENSLHINEKVYGYSPLMLSCLYYNSYSSIECVEFLLENNADINSVDDNSRNCLMVLCLQHKLNECINLLKLLISKGIDINHTDNNGNSILSYISEKTEEEQKYKSDIVDML